MTPFNIYVNTNFLVRQQQWFKFIHLINDSHFGGLVQCDFSPLRNVNKMDLTEGAERIRNVPNAGGSSVVSESLSFELLGRCFGAKLLKVNK